MCWAWAALPLSFVSGSFRGAPSATAAPSWTRSVTAASAAAASKMATCSLTRPARLLPPLPTIPSPLPRTLTPADPCSGGCRLTSEDHALWWGMGQGGGHGTFSFSKDWGYFAEDPRTGHLWGGLRAPLLTPSFEALIKHKSGSQVGNGEYAAERIVLRALCLLLFPKGPSTTLSSHGHSWQLELCFYETAVHFPSSSCCP